MSIRFVPSRVDGLPDVAEVAVYPDRLEIKSAGEWFVFPFAAMAVWPRPAWLRKLLARFGLRPRWLPVGDRDWFHRPPNRFFAFYTKPRVTVFMPEDELAEPHGQTYFARVQRIIMDGGYNTYDLG